MSKEQVLHTTKIEARTFVQSPLLLPSAKDRSRFSKLFAEADDEILEIRIIRTVNNTGE